MVDSESRTHLDALCRHLTPTERAHRLARLARAPWLVPVLRWVSDYELAAVERATLWLELRPHPEYRWQVNTADLLLEQWIDFLPNSFTRRLSARTMLPSGRRRGAPPHDPGCKHATKGRPITTAPVQEVRAIVAALPCCSVCFGMSVDVRDLQGRPAREAAVVGALSRDRARWAWPWEGASPTRLYGDTLAVILANVRESATRADLAPLSTPLALAADATRQAAVDVVTGSLLSLTGLDRETLALVAADDLEVMAALLNPDDPDRDTVTPASVAAHLRALTDLDASGRPLELTSLR